ncbi:adenine nucleotide alpha hydrolase [Shinella sp.]|uniref:adenine nucleotide alpha hydrolase n=1 Tax=Shinella sp. TaxID=1870904 RepID=UPI003F6F257D
MSRPLGDVIGEIGTAALALSGGVDSMTLAVFAGRHLGPSLVTMMHAVSAAVPAEATARVEAWARREGWRLELIDAGEFSDENYRANPVDRCFFCKGNLYGTIASRTGATILSGTNTDDLGEYRPGLDAAKRNAVRHPFVEAGMDKPAVRSLARTLGLGDLAELPSSPCLSSRVETTIRIEPAILVAIHAVEKLVAARLAPETVRCRLRRSGIVVELDPASLSAAGDDVRLTLTGDIAALLPPEIAGAAIAFAPYRNGSAFLREGA